MTPVSLCSSLSSCPLNDKNEERGDKKELRETCGNGQLDKDVVCKDCGHTIYDVILSLSAKTITQKELEVFPMQSCGAFWISRGMSVKTLLSMKICDDDEPLVAAKKRLSVRKQNKEVMQLPPRTTTSSAASESVYFYCFFFFCSFPLRDVQISEALIPYYFVFIIFFSVLSSVIVVYIIVL